MCYAAPKRPVYPCSTDTTAAKFQELVALIHRPIVRGSLSASTTSSDTKHSRPRSGSVIFADMKDASSASSTSPVYEIVKAELTKQPYLAKFIGKAHGIETTLLICAIEYAHPKVVALLLKSKVLDLKQTVGSGPAAAEQGICALVTAVAQLNDDRREIHRIADYKSKCVAIIEMLIAAGVSPTETLATHSGEISAVSEFERIRASIGDAALDERLRRALMPTCYESTCKVVTAFFCCHCCCSTTPCCAPD